MTGLAERLTPPALVPHPGVHLGLRRHSIIAFDAPSIYELTRTVEAVDDTHRRVPASEVADMIEGQCDTGWVDAFVGIDAEHQICVVATMRVLRRITDCTNAVVNAYVHPHRRGRGLGRTLLYWQDGQVHQILVETFGANSEILSLIHNFVSAHMTDRRRPYIAAGFYTERTLQIMYCELEGSEKALKAKHGYSVVPWGEVATADVRYIHMDALLEHYRPPLRGIWWDKAIEELDPRWSLVVLDPHGRLAGYCPTGRPAECWIANGRTEAYIYPLGVGAEHRGHSFSTIPLGVTASAAATSGVSRIGLDVDTGNPSNVHMIYGRLGFVDGFAEVLYMIDRQGRECATTDPDALSGETLPADTTCPSNTVLSTPVSLPESHHDIVWEAFEPAHLHKLTALISRMETQGNPPYRTSTDEVAEMLAEDRTWRGLAGLATREIARGRTAAFDQVVLRKLGIVECLYQDGVDPPFRRTGLGGSLVVWREAIVRQMLARTPDLGRTQIVMQVEVGQEGLKEQLKLQGFHWARTYYEFHADLSRVPNAPDLGSYPRIEPWGPEWEEPARVASNRLSGLEWGRPPLIQEQ